MYYHVRFELDSSTSSKELKLDMTAEQLQERIIRPYELGQPIIINGRTIRPAEIERVRVSRSDVPADNIIPALEQEDRNSSVVVFGGPSYEWRVAARATDVTDEFIQGPPGHAASTAEAGRVQTMNAEASSDSVFIVHGHDHALKAELEVFLSEIGLNPIVLHRQPDEGLTVIEKFERHANVPFAFVLLTPDDFAYSAAEADKPEPERKVEFRARQNVVFEMGFFVGKLGRSGVCCIYKSDVALPSDLAGLVYKPVTNSIGEIGYSLIKELQAAGLKPRVG